MIKVSRVRVGFAALICSSASTLALAQARPTAQPPSGPSAAPAAQMTLHEVVVTAQRREESLSKTPVAVQVVSAATLEKAQVTSELDLRFATPGLQIRSGVTSNEISFSLRGQSQDPQSDTRPGVLPYFNEIPVAGQGFTTAFYDLQSVQVLKGPQGTLFGRSATGGAVLYTTQKPTDTLGGYVSALAGNYDARQFEGALNVPIVDQHVLARVAVFYSYRDGMQHNYYTGDRIGDLERAGGRGSLTFNFGRFHDTAVLDYFHADGQSIQAVFSGIVGPYTGNGPPYLPLAFLYAGTATPTATVTGECTVQAFVGFPSCATAGVNPAVAAYYQHYFSEPGHPNTGLPGVLAMQQQAGPYHPLTNGRNFYGADNAILTNVSTYELAPDLQLKNIFGFVHSNVNASMDVDSTPYGIQNNLTGPRADTRQATDELQLSGKALDHRLSYVAGLFYSNEMTPYFFTGNFFDILFGGGPDTYHHEGTSLTYAGYAQGTYKLTDSGLSVTGGLRYTSEKVGEIIYNNDVNAADCGQAGFSCDQHRTFDNLNYTVGLEDQIRPDLLLYVTTRQAYKNGGFNGFLAPKVGDGASDGGDGFDAERVRDVEVGSKFQGRIQGFPVSANLAVYDSWIHNDQRTAYVANPAPGTEVVNVPSANIYGLEFDGQVVPLEWLTLGATVNYTNARDTDGNISVTTVNAAGATTNVQEAYNEVPDTPTVSGSIFADTVTPIRGDLQLLLHGDLYYQSEVYGATQSFNNAGSTIPPYALANFRVGLQNDAQHWSLTANIKNAFDRTYYVGAFALGELYQVNNRIPGDLRTFTVEARYKF